MRAKALANELMLRKEPSENFIEQTIEEGAIELPPEERKSDEKPKPPDMHASSD